MIKNSVCICLNSVSRLYYVHAESRDLLFSFCIFFNILFLRYFQLDCVHTAILWILLMSKLMLVPGKVSFQKTAESFLTGVFHEQKINYDFYSVSASMETRQQPWSISNCISFLLAYLRYVAPRASFCQYRKIKSKIIVFVKLKAESFKCRSN